MANPRDPLPRLLKALMMELDLILQAYDKLEYIRDSINEHQMNDIHQYIDNFVSCYNLPPQGDSSHHISTVYCEGDICELALRIFFREERKQTIGSSLETFFKEELKPPFVEAIKRVKNLQDFLKAVHPSEIPSSTSCSLPTPREGDQAMRTDILSGIRQLHKRIENIRNQITCPSSTS